MCLILLAHRAHPAYPLVLASNRDELYARPAAPAAVWPDAPRVLAGRDLRGGGTWMGVTRDGRWAALTNHRDPRAERAGAPSRGELVSDYLRGSLPPAEYLARLRPRAPEYNGFNLLLGDAGSALWFSNRAGHAGEPLRPGVHGLSNALLDTPWPKVRRGRRELARLLDDSGEPDPDHLLDVLLDRAYAADHLLPDTGVGMEWERALSASFIATPDYGTRASTALLIDHEGGILLVERTFAPGSTGWSEVRYRFPPGS
jgi:uncharacterized protein with NRDE domain